MSATANARDSLTKTACKELLFKSLGDAVEYGLLYTRLGPHSPLESGFLDWIEDIVAHLPEDERSIATCVYAMYNRIVKRAQDQPFRIVENVDPLAPRPEPVRMFCSDGTSSIIEQVPCRQLQPPPPGQPFAITANTPGMLPVNQPFRVTFTPIVPVDPRDNFLRGASCDVARDGKIRLNDAPPVLSMEALGQRHMKSAEASSSKKPPLKNEKPLIRILTSMSRTPRKPLEKKTSAKHTSPPCISLSPPQATIEEPAKALAANDAKSVTTPSEVETIPFPTGPSSPPYPEPPLPLLAREKEDEQTSELPAAPLLPIVPPSCAPTPQATNRGLRRTHAFVHDSHPDVFWTKAFGNTPKPPLQRSHAFVHDSHPEIFWTAAFGEKPEPGVEPAAETHLPPPAPVPPSNKLKKLRRSSRMKTSPTPAAQAPSKRGKGKGKKRVREEDEDEESPPRQRARADGTTGEPSTPNLSRRIKGALSRVFSK